MERRVRASASGRFPDAPFSAERGSLGACVGSGGALDLQASSDWIGPMGWLQLRRHQVAKNLNSLVLREVVAEPVGCGGVDELCLGGLRSGLDSGFGRERMLHPGNAHLAQSFRVVVSRAEF
jgi:hypothetical protein